MYLKRKRLLVLLKQMGISQTELAKRIGISRQMLSLLMLRKKKVSLKVSHQLVEIFGKRTWGFIMDTSMIGGVNFEYFGIEQIINPNYKLTDRYKKKEI